jgi:carbon-monoxide dehydrogenase medium subunit
MAMFKFCRPGNLPGALELLRDFQNDAVVYAGGTDLTQMLKNGLIQPRYVVAIGQIEGLDQMYSDWKSIFLGPMVTHQQVKQSSLIQQYAEVLADASGMVGSPQTRNLGTVAGNLGNASPSSDTAPALLVLDAVLRVSNREGEHMTPLESFFIGPKKTCLKPDELITEVRFKRVERGEGSAYCKLGRRSNATMAVASAAAYVKLDEKGSRIDELRIALGSVAPTPVRASETEGKAVGLAIDEVHEIIEKELRKEICPISDIRGTKEYRERVAPVLVRRAVEMAVMRARNSLEAGIWSK